jgi:hypothetical protein
MGQVIPFVLKKRDKPTKKILGHRISFYHKEEIELALLSLNTYGYGDRRFTAKNISEVDPLYIRRCLLSLKDSGLLSNLAAKAVTNIVSTIEEVTEIQDAN